MMTTDNKLFITNTMPNIIARAMNEVVGFSGIIATESGREKSTDAFLPSSDTLDADWMISKYGQRGASGLAVRIGETSFRGFIRQLGNDYNMTGLEYRLLSSRQRLRFGFEKLAGFLNDNMDWTFEIGNDQDAWIWKILPGRERITCNSIWTSFFSGFLQEYLSWSTGGRFYLL